MAATISVELPPDRTYGNLTLTCRVNKRGARDWELKFFAYSSDSLSDRLRDDIKRSEYFVYEGDDEKFDHLSISFECYCYKAEIREGFERLREYARKHCEFVNRDGDLLEAAYKYMERR